MNKPTHQSRWRQTLTVKLIAEPLRVFKDNNKPHTAFKEMKEANWSEAIFKENSEVQTLYTCGREQLRGRESWEEVELQEIKTHQIVAHECPIRTALDRIIRQQRLFVLTEAGISHILTLADFNKQPAQMMAFGIIQDFEKELLDAIRRELKLESAITNSLAKHRNKFESAFKLQSDRNKNGQDLHLSDCLTLTHKFELARLEELVQITRLFGDSRKQITNYSAPIKELRNNLAHGQSSGDLKGGWENVRETLEKIEEATRQLQG